MKPTIANAVLSVVLVALCEFSNCHSARSANFAPMLGTLNGPDYLVSIDRNTGVGSRIGHLGINGIDAMTALEYDARHGVLYGAAWVPGGGTLFKVSPTTGAATRIGLAGALGFSPKGLASDPIADVLYGAGDDVETISRKSLYKINRATGASTKLGDVSGISYSIQDLTFDPVTRTLYGLDETLPSGARVVKIDPATLVATPVSGIISTRTGWNGLTFDPVTNALFATDDREMYRVDPLSGTISSVGLTLAPGQEVYGALTVMVPEPVCGASAFALTFAALGRRWRGR